MKRLVWTLAVLAAMGLGTSSTFAGGPEPLHFDLVGNIERQSPVEQYSDWPWRPGIDGAGFNDCSANERCIVNPTSCSWDVDDHWTKFALNDQLAAGGSASDVSCVIASQNPILRTVNGTTAWWSTVPNRFRAEITAPSDRLLVTVDWQARTYTVEPVWDQAQRRYIYAMCVDAVYGPGDPALVPIVGSNASTVAGTSDALGVPSTLTLTVANPTDRKIRSISGQIGMTGSAGCQA